MRRRSYLALLASALGAGCVSDAVVVDARPRTVRVTVGDPASVTGTENARPHTVSVATGVEIRALELDVQRVSPDGDVVNQVVDRSDAFPAGGRLNVTLVEPARYEVVVSVPETGREAEFVVDRRWFDCNASAHNATVPPSGAVEVTEVSTAMARATPGDGSTPTATAVPDDSTAESGSEESTRTPTASTESA